MEDEYTLQIDNALAMLAEKIAEVNQRIDSLSTVDLPTDVIEMYAKAKVVDRYVAMGVPVNAALAIVGIEVDTDMLASNTVDQSEVIEGYQTTMRSLQSSIEALKSVFDYAKMYDDKEDDSDKAMTEEEEEGVSDETEETSETSETSEDDTDEEDSKED
jgi:hypothetical protein